MRKLISLGVSFLLVFSLVHITIQALAQDLTMPTCEEVSQKSIKICSRKIPEDLPRIFIITNRPYKQETVKQEYFPNEVADSLTYIIAVCKADTWLFHFVSGFEEGMNKVNNGQNIVLFIEGHGKTLPMALERAFQVQARYGLSVVVYDWPSDNRSFNGSLHMIRRCEGNFYKLLLQLKEYRRRQMNGSQHLSILAHSMGNYFLKYSVERDTGLNLKAVFVDNTIMNAPAIPSKGHAKSISEMVFQKRIYITSNKNDMVLRAASALTSTRMLGNVAVKPLAINAHYLDFSGIAGTEHSYYYGYQVFEHSIPVFYYFYNSALHGNEVDFSNTDMFVLRKNGIYHAIKGNRDR
jgi:hypothetical protein